MRSSARTLSTLSARLSRRGLIGFVTTISTVGSRPASTDADGFAPSASRLSLPPLQHGYTRLYLVRHGETDWNVEGRIQGRTDNELNDNGRAQARDVSEALADAPIDCIVSSSLRRAIMTADAVAVNHPNAQRSKDARFAEMCFGGDVPLPTPLDHLACVVCHLSPCLITSLLSSQTLKARSCESSSPSTRSTFDGGEPAKATLPFLEPEAKVPPRFQSAVSRDCGRSASLVHCLQHSATCALLHMAASTKSSSPPCKATWPRPPISSRATRVSTSSI